MTPTHVVFCVSDESEDIYDMKKHPFVMLAQFTQAKYLVVIPIWAFNEMAEKVIEISNFSHYVLSFTLQLLLQLLLLLLPLQLPLLLPLFTFLHCITFDLLC